jgi:hypothetical protein
VKADRPMKHSVAVDAAFGLRSHWLNARCLKAEQCSTRWEGVQGRLLQGQASLILVAASRQTTQLADGRRDWV